jgi:hypothetical protein
MDGHSQPTTATLQAIVDAPAHDEPYRFGRRPTVQAPFPFTEGQFARLPIVRSRVRAALSLADEPEA